MVRTMLRNHAAVLMDEPTSSLDEHSKHIVHNLITAVGTSIVVTHDLEFAKTFADRVVRISNGSMG